MAFYGSGNRYYEIGYSDLFYQLKKDSFLKNHILLYNYMKNKKSGGKAKFKSLVKMEKQITSRLGRSN